MGRVAKALLHNAVSIIVRELSIVCTDQVIKTGEQEGEKKRWSGEREREKKNQRNVSPSFYDDSEERLLHCRSFRGKKKNLPQEKISLIFFIINSRTVYFPHYEKME